MERLAIVLTPAGAIMGGLEEIQGTDGLLDGFELRKPRAMNVVPTGPGQAQVQFLECLGSPDVMHLPADVVWYIPKARNILDTYLQAVSGLHLVSASRLPRNLRGN